MPEWVWVWVGKIGLVVGVMAGVIKLVKDLTAPAAKLVVDVEHSRFEWPPVFRANIDEALRRLNPNRMARALLKYGGALNAEEVASKAAASVADYLETEALADQVERSFFIKGVWFLKVRNNGRKASSGVLLKVPDARGLVYLERDERPLEVPEGGRVALGDLQPGDETLVILWSQFLPSDYKAEEIRISDSNGIGTVRLALSLGFAPGFVHKPVGFMKSMGWKFGVFFLGVLILLIAGSIFQAERSSHSASPSTLPTQDTPAH